MFKELVDIKENNIKQFDMELLNILLSDKSSKKNIIWATDNYINHGIMYSPNKEILPEFITGYNGNIIKPRTKKSKIEQDNRIRKKAEVFTPAWMCNEQNSLIDTAWFGKENVFNSILECGWKTNKEKIVFSDNKKWSDYVKAIRMEISCGEAPYLVSRYDTTNGDVIPVTERIGILDRKLRIVNENTENIEEWFFWCTEAYKSIYGFEWQGDSLLIARENLLYTFTDNFLYKFNKKPTIEMIYTIADIISWNIFQMDGIKYVIPDSCKNDIEIQYTIFGEEKVEVCCKGCLYNNINSHNGIYVKIKNWETGKIIKFISLFKKGKK